MVSVMQPYMDIESSRSYIDELYSPDPQKCLDAIICLKNSVIGSNRQKGSVIAQGVVPRLLQLLGDTSGTVGDRVRLESAVTLGSLAKGTDQHVLALIDLGVVPLLLQVLLTAPTPEISMDGKTKVLDQLNEACLRCLRTVFQHAAAPVHSIYQDPALVPRLLSLASRSVTCQVCVATILTTACKTTEEQNALSKGGAVETLAMQLDSPLSDIQLPALACLANMCYQNHMVSAMVASASTNNTVHGRGEGEGDLLTVASSTLCNLLLEFSPSKEPILESGGVELLCSLTKRPESALRLNGIWALMNVAFQAEQRVKSQILSCLGTDQIFRLLADPELSVLMKTLGLLRNLLSTKAHIDRIMGEHATHVMQAVILVLEDPEHPADVKEQALCILANVADGDRARDHIMANDDVLKKLMDYMSQDCPIAILRALNLKRIADED
ncbi:armadillo repeat-containing protein 8-like protein [Lasius niger]|uniref:Armadillo repeat-containing protein 8 n=1 Tax=Lasius niger TaxID=67767 RepID=A0A0J7L802_LASNI|nr:armadillo repeat-containing protein 8-like protein [Lasius niger]